MQSIYFNATDRKRRIKVSFLMAFYPTNQKQMWVSYDPTIFPIENLARLLGLLLSGSKQPPEVFCKTGAFRNLQENTCARESF